MMRLSLVAGALAAFLILAPAASAQIGEKITIELSAQHTEMNLDESRSMNMPIIVKVKVKNFVCAQPWAILVKVDADRAGFPEWAGASVNPDAVTITIPATKPGVEEESYADDSTIKFEVHWGEDRPAKNARYVYTLKPSTESKPIDGPCVPVSITPEYKDLQMTALMPDIQDNATGPPDCNQTPVPDLPECQTTPTALEQEEGGKAPGFDVALLALASLAGAVLIRRRA